MPLSFTCPQCGKSYENVSDQYAGKRMKCKCGKVMRLGSAAPATEKPTQPVPVQPVPVKPVAVEPIQPAAPAAPVPVQPLTPINEVADPIFGTGQKIASAPTPTPAPTGGTDDLFSGMEPPPAGNPFENTGYAPPAPIARPKPRKTKRRRHQSSAGPTFSIISGALGTFFALGCLAFFGIVVFGFVAGIASAQASPPPQVLFVGIAFIILMLLSLAMTGGCGYSAITGIMELTNEYRNPGPSQMAGTACIAFTVVTFILYLVAIIMSFALQADVGQVRYNEGNAVGMIIGLLIGFILLVLFLAIPIFVFCVGYFRNKKA